MRKVADSVRGLLLAGIVDGTGTYTIGVERVDTPEQARMWTDRYHAAGFQQMKIYSSVKLEELKVVADEAHRLGMTVTGHVPEGLNAYQAIEAGQDQINHIGYIADIMKAPLPEGASRLDRYKAGANIDLDSPEAQESAGVPERASHGGRSDHRADGILHRDHRQTARQL